MLCKCQVGLGGGHELSREQPQGCSNTLCLTARRGTPPQPLHLISPAFPRLNIKPQGILRRCLGLLAGTPGPPSCHRISQGSSLPLPQPRGFPSSSYQNKPPVSALGAFEHEMQPAAGPQALGHGQVSSIAGWADVAPAWPAGGGLNRMRSLQAPGGFPGHLKGS